MDVGGSRCGRLLIHKALNSEYGSSKWDINNVQISSKMQDCACRTIVERGVEQQGLIQQTENRDHNHNHSSDGTILRTCTMTTLHKREEKVTLLMGRDVMNALAKSCEHGCVAVMIDRLLLDAEGRVRWEYVDSLEVENSDLLGSRY